MYRKKPRFIPKINATIQTPMINQVVILKWKNKDHVALTTIWDHINNATFLLNKAWKTSNEAWLGLENTYLASDIVTQIHL